MIKDYYTNGRWLRNPQDPPKDYDLAIFVCNKSEADILKNKVSDSIIKNIKDSDTGSVFGDYNDYKYISLNIFNSYYLSLNMFNISSNIFNSYYFYTLTPKISNIAIVIFEKEFYVFADDKLIAHDIFINWINRVVDMFEQDAADKFKQEKRVLGSVFMYYFLFALMSDFNSMLEYLYGMIYYYSKHYYSKQTGTILIEDKTLKLKFQQIKNSFIKKYRQIKTNPIKNLVQIKHLILELRLYFTDIKEVLRKIQPLFRETSEYYNKLSDTKEKCDDELY